MLSILHISIAYIIKMFIPGFGKVHGHMTTCTTCRSCCKNQNLGQPLSRDKLTPAQQHPAIAKHGQQQLMTSDTPTELLGCRLTKTNFTFLLTWQDIQSLFLPVKILETFDSKAMMFHTWTKYFQQF